LQISKEKFKQYGWLAGLLILTCVLYYPAFLAQYVWDDLLLFVANDDLRSGSFSWEILSKPILAGASYFRPFVLFSFVLEFYLTDAKPLVSHIVNLTFFLVNVFLLYVLIDNLAKKLGQLRPQRLALWGSSIYAIHPALIETTVWVSGRFDLFAATFILAGLVIYLEVKNKLLQIILINLCLLFALGSKEIGIILLPALMVLQLILLPIQENIFKQILIAFKNQKFLWLSLGFNLLCYLALRMNALGSIYNDSPLVEEIYLIEDWRIVLPLQTFIFYLKSIIFPFFPSPVHIINPDFINSNIGKLLTVLSIFLILLLGYFAFVRKNKAALLFGVSFLAILPVMHIVTLRILDNIGHDRFLTVPLIFFILGLVLLPWQELANKASLLFNFLKLVFLTWVGVCIVTVHTVVPLWQTEFKLWSWAYHQQPTSKIARASYIAVLQREKRDDLLLPIFEKIKNNMDVKEQLIYSGYLIDHQNPEGILYLRGVLESVRPFHEIYKSSKDPEAQKFVNMFDPLAYGYFQLSGYYLIYQHDYKKAYKNSQIALWYFPESPPIIARNALALYALGRKNEAEAMFAKAVRAYHYSEKASVYIDRYNFITHECYQKRLPQHICDDPNILRMN